MDDEQNNKKKLSLTALILMIFTSVFGFANIARAYYLMGYASILWYVLAALTFFLPFAFMLSEFGAAFKDEKGGIYSWMAKSINPKFSFVGTVMWYSSNVIWMVSTGISIWIPLSNGIFGVDKTQQWSFLGLNSVQSLGLLGALWILFITFFSSKGLDKIEKVTNIGGIAVVLLNIVLISVGIFILVMNKGQMAEPLSVAKFVKSPNPDYGSIISVFSFLVFAVFAYAGLEVIGGLVDETENPEVNFPKGIKISAIVIAAGYAIGIFIMGVFTNWSYAFTEFSEADITLGNVAYVAMNNMGYQLGSTLNLTESVSREIGIWMGRYIGISMFLALTGSFFTLTFSPLKQLIEGTPKETWPKKWTKIKNGLPVHAMYVQSAVVITIILFVSFGGKSAKEFFNILISMTNVSVSIPFMFIVIAFYGFKKNESIEKPFVIFKSKNGYKYIVVMVTFVLAFANIFTVVEPAIHGHYSETFFSMLGPIFFCSVALILFNRYEKKQNQLLQESTINPVMEDSFVD
ncbi:glutamate/gamma-aminobutyrate family transporter YjeM [Vagococcus carniphilus]|uniref:glutamate/gamma-aminobutyrate family transporter YjeM n=1 Tax=Vagococcus carniphilus TaxID=218144 RepID=UPI002891376E|nr:glutamate/gamma-aminobutyrate family transporter YjeM [Vagococcus carniphilus]MDT2829384.1 glutamate/gamma-aminobutyrate family transporter YjeM [Vagococcus carniphilus]MDT2838843.1 glutamate/gamma-aminobutyrate family transporter YjeM [Vagococcus carniphilus]MDT2852901.1 glutamate/gamma-aminobutyrate family transporter YjeM [Vagococcus carniphilus]